MVVGRGTSEGEEVVDVTRLLPAGEESSSIHTSTDPLITFSIVTNDKQL